MTHITLLDEPSRRDIVVIGGSAGSIEALHELVQQLPADLPIAIFLVVHVLPSAQSRLPHILHRAGRLPVRHAVDGDPIQPGQILVAPPDLHMVLHAERVELNRGPRENSTRPAIDPLFRSAAEVFGARVCGVVLSGHLDDGSDGLRMIAEAGGLALVQDPKEASHSEMPRNALRVTPSARAMTAARIGRAIATLSGPVAQPPDPEKASEATLLDVQVGAGDPGGLPSGLTCPDCGGVLWAEPGSENLHCRVGHRYSLQTLQEQQQESVERAMWAAVRALREDASLARHLAERAQSHGRTHTATRFDQRRRQADEHADVLERILLDRQPDDDEQQLSSS